MNKTPTLAVLGREVAFDSMSNRDGHQLMRSQVKKCKENEIYLKVTIGVCRLTQSFNNVIYGPRKLMTAV